MVDLLDQGDDLGNPFAPREQDPVRTPAVAAQPALPAPQSDPEFDEIYAEVSRRNLERTVQMRDAAIRSTYREAMQDNPHLAGKVREMASLAGLPIEQAEQDPEFLQQALALRQIEHMRVQTGGRLDDFFATPVNMRVSHDDVRNLGFLATVWGNAQAGYYQSKLGGLVEEMAREGGPEARPDLDAEIRALRQDLEKMPQTTEGTMGTGFVYGLFKTLGQYFDFAQYGLFTAGVAATPGAAATAAFPPAAVSIPFLAKGGFLYGTALRSARVQAGNAIDSLVAMNVEGFPGISYQQAWESVNLASSIAGALDVVGMGMLTAPLRSALSNRIANETAKRLIAQPTMRAAAMGPLRSYLGAVGGELGTEILQGVTLRYLGENPAMAEAMRSGAILDTRKQQAFSEVLGETIAETIRMTALLGGIGPMTSLHRATTRVEEAKQIEKFVQQLADPIAATETSKRSGTVMEQFLQIVGQDGPIESFFVDVGEFLEAMKKAGVTMDALRELAPQVASQLDDANQTGTVQIPTATWGGRFLSGAFGKTLNPILRVTPDGPSVAEIPELEAQASKILQGLEQAVQTEQAKVQDAADAAKQAEADAAKALRLEKAREGVELQRDVAEQVKEAGHRHDHARTFARLYRLSAERMAKHLGMSLREFHAKHGNRWMSELEAKINKLAEDAKQFNQEGNRRTDTPEFKAWFRDSVVVDEKGEPLVMYHGTDAEFDSFNADKSPLMFFSRSKGTAESYAADRARPRQGRVGAYFLSAAKTATAKDVADVDISKEVGALSDTNPDNAAYLAERAAFIKSRIAKPQGWMFTKASESAVWRDVLVPALKRAGFDSLAVDDAGDTGSSFAVFDPTQIKSVNNRGTFDPNDPNILNQPARGSYNPAERLTRAVQSEGANFSTLVHELGHFVLETMGGIAATMPDQDGKPSPIARDMRELLRWFRESKVLDLDPDAPDAIAQWNALTVEQKRLAHETLAYNFERYLMVGEAPTANLQTVFGRIKAYMIAVYQGLVETIGANYRQATGRELPALSGEVRQVFDRMFANEKAVEAHEAANNMLPAFQTREQFVEAGLPEDKWDEYRAAMEEAKAEALAWLDAAANRAMSMVGNAAKRLQSHLRKQDAELRKQVRKEAVADLRNQPVYMAQELLRKSPGEAKLGLEQVRALLRQAGHTEEQVVEAVKKLGYGKSGLLAAKGMDVDTAAEILDYPDGAALVRALVDAPAFDEAVDARVEAAINAHYGVTDVDKADRQVESAKRAMITRALSGQARARFAAVEYGFLNKAAGNSRSLTNAAKRAARLLLGRTRIRDIQPARFEKQAGRANQALQKASKGQDPAGAADHARRKLLNTTLTGQAFKAKEEIRAGLRWMKRLGRKDAKLVKDRDIALASAARALASAFGLTPPGLEDRTAATMELLRKYVPERAEAMQALVDRATANKQVGDYRDLTLDQFREVVETVKELWAQAERERFALVDGKRQAVEEVAAKVAEAVRAKLPERRFGEGRQATALEKFVRKFHGTLARLRIMEHMYRWIDGGKRGIVTQAMFEGLKDGIVRARAEAAPVKRRFVDRVRKLGLGRDKSTIRMEGIGYTLGAKEPTTAGRLVERLLGSRLTAKAELFGMLLNSGNAGNLRHMLAAGDGRRSFVKIDPQTGEVDVAAWFAEIQRLIDAGVIDEAMLDAVQESWDDLKALLPMIQKSHMEQKGMPMSEVVHQPFTVTLPDGRSKTYAGGYYPVKPDRDRAGTGEIGTLEETLAQSHDLAPQSAEAWTIERVKNAMAMPLTFDPAIMLNHVDQAFRFVHVNPRIRDVLKLLRNQGVKDAFERHDPHIIKGSIIPQLQRFASQTMYEKPPDQLSDQFWRSLTRSTAVANMMGNLVNTLQQFTALSNAINHMGLRWTKEGLMTFLRNAKTAHADISAKSGFMADRFRNQVFELRTELDTILNEPGPFQKMREWTVRNTYFMQAYAQNRVDPIVWYGAYAKAMAEADPNMSAEQMERNALQEADAAVRLTQGSYSPEDLAQYQVGTGFKRAWVQFTGFFNVLANQIAYSDEKAKAAFLAFIIPMIASEAITWTLHGKWADEEDDGVADEAYEFLVMSQVKGMAAMAPGYGPALLGLVKQVSGDREFSDRLSAAPAISFLQRALVGASTFAKAAAGEDREVRGRMAQDALFFVGWATGIPTAAVAKPANFLTEALSGNVNPTGPLDWIFGTATGKPSVESKR